MWADRFSLSRAHTRAGRLFVSHPSQIEESQLTKSNDVTSFQQYVAINRILAWLYGEAGESQEALLSLVQLDGHAHENEEGKRQETSGGSCGAKAGGTAASVVVGRRGVRIPAQQPERSASSRLEFETEQPSLTAELGDCDQLQSPTSLVKEGSRGRLSGSSTC